MRVLSAERSFEPCAESGWYGYDIHLGEPVGEALISALGALGRLSCVRSLKRPFFVVRGDGFLIRGIVGDRFLRAGFAERDAPQMERLLAAVAACVPD